jgi:hypothetical protein
MLDDENPMVDLLTERELSELLSAPESQTLGRKRARIHPRDLATTLIAFANAEGGRLLELRGEGPEAAELERELNERVYWLFGLTGEEIALGGR